MTEHASNHPPRADYLWLFLLTLPALYPLLGSGIFASHDGLHHIYRLFDLTYSLRGGAVFPRWLPHLGFGYGYPVLNYYAPLAYYLALPFMALGGGPILGIKIVYLLGFFGASFGMYGLARPFVGRLGALVAAAAYTYLPYHLADAYVRGALPEFLAFVWIPFILWAMHRAITETSITHVALAGLGIAGLVLTHNLSVVLGAPLIVLFAVATAWITRRWRRLAWLGLALAVAVLVTAFYWLPALFEVDAIRASQVHQEPAMLLTQLVPISELLSPYAFYRYFPDQGRLIAHPLGLMPAALALAALVSVAVRWRRLQPSQRVWAGICAATLLGATVMMTPLSAPLWAGIPGLSYLQFPWRWQLLSGFGIAGLIGSGLMDIRRPARSWEPKPSWLAWTGVLGIIVLLAAAGMLRLPHDGQLYPGEDRFLGHADVSLEGMAAYEHELFLATRLWGDPKSLEYMPVWVSEPVEDLILPAARNGPPAGASGSPIARVVVERHAPLRLDLQVAATGEASLRLHTFYFPGWSARMDGEPVETYPSTSLGLLSVDVPAGEHRLTIRFGNTPLRWIGAIISLVSAAGVGVWLFVTRRRRVLVYALIACIVLAGIWLWQGGRQTTMSPRAAWANFGNQMALAGYRLAPPEKAGQPIAVDLWWLALQEPAANYKVFLHLEDPSGRRWAQRDAQPVFDMAPTTRWAENELVWDHHTLHMQAGAPAGEYRVFVGIYEVDTVLNLDILDEMRNPQGQRLLLETITLP